MNVRKVLMSRPTFFDVVYEINPWMDTRGKIDKSKALTQWENVVIAYKRLGVKVELIDPDPEYPDMVFCANVGLVKGNVFLRSNFRYDERKKEAYLAEEWFKEHDFETRIMPESVFFEGTGDAIICSDFILGGYGYRSLRDAYDYVEGVFRMEVIPLKLRSDRFYHLDTCLGVLDDDNVLCFPESFSRKDLEKIKGCVKNVILVSKQDNAKLACNCVCINGNVVINKGISKKLKSQLMKLGYNVIEVDTSEFLKAGGSIWCMTLIFQD